MLGSELQDSHSFPAKSVDDFRRRGLFILFHEIAPTIFESQVLVHVSEMRAIGVEMEVWVFALDLKSYELSVERAPILADRHRVTIRVFRGFRFGLVLGDPVNVWRLWQALRKSYFLPSFIHARTDYSAFLCGLLRPFFGYELIWDCRGDAVAEHRIAHIKAGIVRRILIYSKSAVMAFQRAAVRRLCTRAIFVSEQLRTIAIGRSSRVPSEIIPCVASPQLFHFSTDLRNSVRRQLGIASDKRVLIYSGSISFFQCFEQSVALFRRVLEKDPGAIFLIVTPDREVARNSVGEIPERNYRIVSTTIADVNGFLNAADFGILLRHSDAINRVASPLKFAEYCLAGLPIIMTAAIEQSVRIGLELGNAFVTELGSIPESFPRLSDSDRRDLALRAALKLGRNAVEQAYRRTYGIANEKERQ